VALAPLAVAADLQTRGVDVSDTDRVDAALASASESVRDAAGCPISEVTATISLPAPAPCEQWLDLPGPVTAVASVEVAGEAVTTFVRQGSSLWLSGGWRTTLEPVNVDVELTFGLAEVPADIVSLVCDLATASLLQDAPTPGNLSSVAIDDYRESYSTGEDAQVSVFEIPPRTRAWLRQRFGSSAIVTGVRQ
jgi:hypothetical protein